jgi:hypothetical protein
MISEAQYINVFFSFSFRLWMQSKIIVDGRFFQVY